MTTIRAIKALSMAGVEPANIQSQEPTFQWVNPSILFVEEAYQRSIAENSVTMIRKIVGRWNWSHIKPPVCVKDGKGRLVVLDGQHTAIAAVSHGGIKKIPIMLVRADTVEQRAQAFISQNRDRLAVTSLHMHYAAVAAGDEIAVAVDQACRKAGIAILKNPRGPRGAYRVGETFAVGIITGAVKRFGVNAVARALKILVEAKRAPVPAHEFAAVCILLFDSEHKGSVDPFDLVTVIRSRTVLEWRSVAAAAASRGGSIRSALALAWKRAAKNA